MGSIHLKKDGRFYKLDENATGAQLKKLLNVPDDSILINARSQEIADNESIGDKVSDGESVAAVPNFRYW